MCPGKHFRAEDLSTSVPAEEGGVTWRGDAGDAERGGVAGGIRLRWGRMKRRAWRKDGSIMQRHLLCEDG